MVARQAHNLEVRGSNPLPAITFITSFKFQKNNFYRGIYEL